MRPLAAKRLRKILEGVIIDGRKEERKLEMRKNRKKTKKKKNNTKTSGSATEQLRRTQYFENVIR